MFEKEQRKLLDELIPSADSCTDRYTFEWKTRDLSDLRALSPRLQLIEK